ncbi:hypothetical protein JTE90_013703 [Oedothorax gibbosus]|uniref:DUF4201 domain-containing protein n=1 Tax=Oedothorax gibbosus TaxID=931172 RepID=A0AAV6UIK5_9ARAC|nr:hypothetical protein JTE90_013703 [Oedothorax gibbosus]
MEKYSELENEIVKNSLGTNELETNKRESKHLEYPSLDLLKETDETKLVNYLNEFSEGSLTLFVEEVQQANSRLQKENDLYEFLLKENKSIKNTLEMMQADTGSFTSDHRKTLLSFPAKCFLANQCLKQLGQIFREEKISFSSDTQDLQFQLEAVNLSLKELKREKENFDSNVRIGGRHAVTKKVILQKVAKFFSDSIKNKMALANKYKMQIQNDKMEHNKLLSQMEEQEKRLASLDLLKYQEAKIQYENSCKSMHYHKNQLSKCKSKFSSITHSVLDIKKSLVKEQLNMQQIQDTVSKKKTMKDLIIYEKARNNQNIKELKATMRKIKLDPRRHDLPEVVEYATVKRENEALKRQIKQWKGKVAVAEQAKLMHLSVLQKKSHTR